MRRSDIDFEKGTWTIATQNREKGTADILPAPATGA